MLGEGQFVAAADEKVELRGYCPRDVVDVLDAVSGADKKSRMDLVVEILTRWCDAEVHKASLLYRIARGNPTLSEAFGAEPERARR